MKHFTAEEIRKIDEINGTLADRYEYFEKLAEMFGGEYTTVRWDKEWVKAVALDDTTVLDIRTKTLKGRRMITFMDVHDFNRSDEHPYGQCDMFELKKGKLVKWEHQ